MRYEEDDNPLPKGTPTLPTGPREEGDGPQGSQVEGDDAALLAEDTGLPKNSNIVSVDDNIITEVEPLNIILSYVIADK